ncbi:rRNA-binding ribosome biosynthesis protein utp25 [Vanrija albida]|uniref:U3 small nucleolar RNA-associated protein 25 n=1 Tax=Vanrija albida TaxID=181172 RepID=A0ABR3QF60_9TREE
MTTATEVKLLTLLNVSAIKRAREGEKPGGFRSPTTSRQQSVDGDAAAPPKRRRSVVFGGELGPSGSTYGQNGKKAKGKGRAEAAPDAETEEAPVPEIELAADSDDDDDEAADNADSFNTHFGAEPAPLTPAAVAAEAEGKWVTSRGSVRGLGRVVEQRVGEASASEGKARLTPAIATAMASKPPLASTYLSQLGTYTDLYAHSLDGEADGSEKGVGAGKHRAALRAAAAAHAINHVLKTRRRIVRNNERLARAAAAGEDAPEPPRDQSFTRPKVLLVLPLRSLALEWLQTHLFPLAGEGTQIENLRPFTASFSVPADEDPLASKKAEGDFPVDHLENFRGNSDDNFRFGIKLTRKAWRVVMPPVNEAKLIECDIVVASPLALKMAAEREDSTDVLSSIEIVIADGLDVLQMQNWDHVQFVFKHLNEIPKSPHGCDFSRVKPWYLDGQARLLRQTLLLSRYDSPESRALFNGCANVAGKVRVDASAGLGGVLDRVRPGVRQIFNRIDVDAPRGAGSLSAEAAVEEVDTRFEYFTKKTIPALLRSAVSRQNTLVVVPSYFDFVRLTNYLRKADSVSYAAVSEYSSNAEISKARTLFFKGKRALLIVTERLHFYRRYKLRGAKTLVFYSLPEHAQFYSEFLATPFIPSREAEAAGADADVDPAEVSSITLFSRFDVLKLERVVGHDDARRMLASTEARFEFA